MSPCIKSLIRIIVFLNSTMDDRGILVKMKNSTMLSNAFVKVAKALKSQGNSFRNNTTIQVYSSELLEEYQQLKKLGEEIDEFKKKRINPVIKIIKKRKNTLNAEKKQFNKASSQFQKILRRENQIKELENMIKDKLKEFETKQYLEPISQFRSLTTSLKYYEVLDGITLILHVKADESVLNDIMDNKWNLTAIGRSEDFIDVQEVTFIELDSNTEIDTMTSNYAAYIDIDLIRSDLVFSKDKGMRTCIGTKYMLNKKYELINNQRVFEQKKVVYVSGHSIDEINSTKNLYVDGEYIVNFL